MSMAYLYNFNKYAKVIINVSILLFLILLFYLKIMRKHPDWQNENQDYSKKTLGFTQISTKKHNHNVSFDPLERFYVYTDQCKIPTVDPFSSESITNYTALNYIDCKNYTVDIVTSNFDANSNHYILHINYEEAMKSFCSSAGCESEELDLRCCYIEIVRLVNATHPDFDPELLDCTDFEQDFIVPSHVNGAIVRCIDPENKIDVLQEFGFVFVQYQKPNKTINLEENQGCNLVRKPGVLLLGIDSVSRINLRRTMPKTFEYFTKNRWIEMKGYNKIGYNTFPNLMALLAGYNEVSALKYCNPKVLGGLDNCTYMWNYFARAGYVTAFAEDECEISTFDYLYKGFARPPTDYYLRPIECAFEKHLKALKLFGGLSQCLGRTQTADYVFDYCSQVAQRYSRLNENVFALCWSNSFSHDYFEGPSLYDAKMTRYFESLYESGVLERNIVVFFSDHGMRWGPLLNHPAGYLEERLPMMFFWIPQWFQHAYPKLVANLKENQNRLTSPYDVYMTLKHIIELGQEENNSTNDVNKTEIPPPFECPTCQSLFLPVPEDRTCSDAGIIEHWCSCYPYISFQDSSFSQKLTHLIVDEINAYIVEKNFSNICGEITPSQIEFSERKFDNDEHSISSMKPIFGDSNFYRIKFNTKSGKLRGDFQATFKYYNQTNSIDLDVETVSRLNSYKNSSKCVDDRQVKKYCFCKDFE